MHGLKKLRQRCLALFAKQTKQKVGNSVEEKRKDKNNVLCIILNIWALRFSEIFKFQHDFSPKLLKYRFVL